MFGELVTAVNRNQYQLSNASNVNQGTIKRKKITCWNCMLQDDHKARKCTGPCKYCSSIDYLYYQCDQHEKRKEPFAVTMFDPGLNAMDVDIAADSLWTTCFFDRHLRTKIVTHQTPPLAKQRRKMWYRLSLLCFISFYCLG
jgi:hypothetical protein